MAEKEFSGVLLDVTFTAASTRENIISAENIALSFGKLAKWYTDFAWSAFTAPTVTVTGSGNAITSASYGTGANANKLTLTKGSTFLTAHPTIPVETDTTSTASPVFGGTFTAVDSVTRDSNGHVLKINTKTVTVPNTTMGAATADTAGTIGLVPAPAAGKQSSFLRGDGTWVVPTNTDTKVTQNRTTANKNYPLILSYYENTSTTTTAQTVNRSDGIYANPSAGKVYMTQLGLISGSYINTIDTATLTANRTQTFPDVSGTIWNSGNAVSTSIGSASTGTALKASKVTLGTALKASKVTLGTALSASKVTLGTALSASKVTVGSTDLTASKVTLGDAFSVKAVNVFTKNTVASLSYDDVSIPNVTGNTSVSIPNVTGNTSVSIPNVTGATDVTIKNITGVTAVSIPNVTGNSNVSIPNVTGNTEVTIPNVTAATDVSVYSVKTINTVVTTAKISKGVLTFSTGASVVRESKTASKVTLGTALKASKVTLGTALSASKVTLGTALSASKVTVGSTDLTASKVTLGDAFSVKAVNVFTKNTVASLSYDDVSIPNVTGNTSVSIPNVTGNTSVSIPNVTGATDVTIKNITGVTAVSIPNVTGNTEVTIPNVTGNTEVTIPNISVTSKNVLSTDIS